LRTTTGLDGRRFSPIVAAPRFGALRAAAVELGRNPIEGSFREARTKLDPAKAGIGCETASWKF